MKGYRGFISLSLFLYNFVVINSSVFATESETTAQTSNVQSNLALTPVHYILGGVLLITVIVMIGVGIYLKQNND